MENLNFHVIGFDLDHTLYPKSKKIDEKIQSYLYGKIAENKKITLSKARSLFDERYKNGSGTSGGQTLRDIGIENGSEIIQEALENADISSMLTPDKNVNSLISQIVSKYKNVDLITGSNMHQTHIKLNALDIPLKTFSHIITADDGSKSNGDNFKKWLSLYPSYNPKHFLYIGDRARLDCDVPSALGIHTALVYVKEVDEKLPCTQYHSLVDTLQDLL